MPATKPAPATNVAEVSATPSSISLKWAQGTAPAADNVTVLAELAQLKTMLSNAQTLLTQIVTNVGKI